MPEVSSAHRTVAQKGVATGLKRHPVCAGVQHPVASRRLGVDTMSVSDFALQKGACLMQVLQINDSSQVSWGGPRSAPRW
eukprot:1534773-Rhodomonas_salina.1